MKMSGQNLRVDATTSVFPEQVSVARAEIAENIQEGLLALAVGAGLQVMQTLMDADVTTLVGLKSKHDRGRTAVRPVPRARLGDPAAGRRGLRLCRAAHRSYELFTSTEILGRMAVKKMLAGQSTPRYPVNLEPAGQQIAKSPRRQSSPRSLAVLRRRPRRRWPSCWPRICPHWIWPR